MICDLVLNSDGLWQCNNCDWVLSVKCKTPPDRDCRGRPSVKPEAITWANQERQQSEAIEAGKKLGWTAEHAKRWAGALMRWVAAGRPVRSDSEVTAIVATCEACKHYAADECRCGVCGCRVGMSGMAVLNKARMGSESCPKGKW